MRNQDTAFDYHRYRQLLSEAVDDDKRLELINLLIEERARDRLAAQIASDRAAMTASTIAKVLGPSRA
jgi:Trp operon repressor